MSLLAGKFKRSFTPIARLYQDAKDASAVDGQTHTVKGWIRFVRSQTKMLFLSVVDGSHPTPFQLCVPAIGSDGKSSSAVRVKIEKWAIAGASIAARGKIVQSPAKGQLIEMLVEDADILGAVGDPAFLPCAKSVPYETVRPHHDQRALCKTYQSIYRIRSALMHIVNEFFQQQGVQYLDPNTITRCGAEGGAQQFTVTALVKDGDLSKIPLLRSSTEAAAAAATATIDIGAGVEVDDKPVVTDKVRATTDDQKLASTAAAVQAAKIDFGKDFFLEQAFLTESSQLQLEALCRGMGAVYTMNPSYRAEPSKTRRHLCCFTHTEWELPFVELPDLMDFSEDLVKHCFRQVLRRCADDLAELNKTVASGVLAKLESFAQAEFARTTYDDAIDTLHRHKDDVLKRFGSEIKALPEWGDDLGSCCERYLAEVHCKRPVFVFNYPRDLKSFYMKQNPAPVSASTASAHAPASAGAATGNEQVRHTVQRCDLLVPFLGELIGSSIRTADYHQLVAEVARRKMDPAPLKWYTELRLSGSAHTGGAGMGFDRLVTICCSGTDGTGIGIHDVVPFPVSYQNPSL